MLMCGVDRVRHLAHDLPLRGGEFESFGSCCAEMNDAGRFCV